MNGTKDYVLCAIGEGMIIKKSEDGKSSMLLSSYRYPFLSLFTWKRRPPKSFQIVPWPDPSDQKSHKQT